MGTRLLKLSQVFALLLFMVASSPSLAQYISGSNWSTTNSSNWWRPGSTLDLDFVNDRYYLNGTTYSGISNFMTAASAVMTRSSTGTYYDSSGILQTAATGVPRLDHDPKTGAAKGLLIEETGTNLVQYSSDFTQAYWTHPTSISATTAAGTAPDGTNTANLMTADGSTLSYFRASSISSSTTMTMSMFAKVGSLSKVIFEFHDTTNCGANCVATFNLSTQSASWSGVSAAEGSLVMTSLPNGWYRVAATFTYSTAQTAGPAIYIGTYGTATGNIYLWGAQLEAKAFLTSYIPSGSTSGTRSKDIFSVPVGTWYNSSAGTFAAETYGQSNSSQNGYGRIIGGDAGKAMLGFYSTNSKLSSWDNTTVLNFTSGMPSAATATNWIRAAMSWNSTTPSRAVAGGGLTAATSSSGTNDFSTTEVGFGSGSNGGSGGFQGYDPLNASIRRATFFPTALSATAVQDLSR